MYSDDNQADARTLMPRNSVGFIVKFPGGDITGRKMTIFPCKVGSVAEPTAFGAPTELNFSFYVTKIPAENITVPVVDAFPVAGRSLADLADGDVIAAGRAGGGDDRAVHPDLAGDFPAALELRVDRVVRGHGAGDRHGHVQGDAAGQAGAARPVGHVRG